MKIEENIIAIRNRSIAEADLAFKDFMNKHGFLICEPEVMDMIVNESHEVAN